MRVASTKNYESRSREAREARGRPRIEFSLSADVVDALRAHAKKTGEPMSSVVEAALREFLSIKH